MPTFVLQGTGKSASRRIDYAKELNQEQLDVVLHGDGPCLVLAGAGSGKTRTVTYRVAYLLEQGVDPSSILLLTFTNKASREMLERVAKLLGQEAHGLWGGTFHSVANRLLRANAQIAGFQKGFTILDQEDSRALIKAVMKDLSIDPKARRFPSAAVLQSIISYSRNVMIPVAEALEMKHPNFESLAKEVEEIARMYDARKKAAQSMDFDDLLLNWLTLIEHPQIGEAMSQRFQYVLVDEYQDTNALQARIVQGLAHVHKNILIVGDDAQSIYAFRGADVKNILSFPEQWENARVFKLLTNYRSVPEILDLANDSLSHNLGQFEKDLIGVKEHGKKPMMVPTTSAKQEAQFVAEQILTLRSQGTALANMAVLFRSSAHSQALEFELVKRDIPYEYRGGMKFFGRAHIKDVLTYLRIIQNPHDETAWLRVLNMQQGIGATTASNLAASAHAFPDAQRIVDTDVSSLLPNRAKEGWGHLVSTVRVILDHPDDPGAMIRAVMESPYRDYLEREYPDYKDRLEDLEQLELFAQSYRGLEQFLADISLYDDAVKGQDAAPSGEERMVLSTIHQAKGLEWDTVFVIHLADQAFPSSRAMEEDGLEEERRLFYVAITRARNRLFLIYPMTTGYDSLNFNRPSLFLEEVSPRLLERLDVREAPRTGVPRLRPTGGDWNFDEPFSSDGDVISINRNGERSRSSAAPTGTVIWKSSSPKKEPPRTSFLRGIDEL
ncbi:MAG: UvrD-helicase domain-containing protein [Patescibacteria group bacterium]|jgi:DNA helicase-2/ATP-dependent DNA helicase PcrA